MAQDSRDPGHSSRGEQIKVQKTKAFTQLVAVFQQKEPSEKRKYSKRQQFTCILVLGFLLLLFVASLGGFFIVWCTNYFDSTIQAGLVLTNKSQAFEWWQKTPIYPLVKVHIFNYTNIQDFLKGNDKKLKVEDLGPLTYKEISEKIDLHHHEDNTITYRENRRYEFLPEQSSSLKLYDEVTVPNIPFLIADRKISQLGSFAKFSASAIVQGLSPTPRPFLTLPVTKFLWGYDDPIINSYKTLSTFTGDAVMFDRFGIIAARKGLSADNYTVHTGIDDISKLGVVTATNGETKLNLYLEDECNRIDGTDGSQFPPTLLDKKSTLHVYIKNFCRKFPLVYDKEVSVFNGIPAWRYKNPSDVFAHPDENPQNQCYCDVESNTCPPSGIHNLTRCAYNTPMMASFPHFYLGDPKLLEPFEGLQPVEQLHETFADIHPRLAFPLNGVSRFQINIELNHPDKVAFTSFEPFAKAVRILPVVWLEVTGGDIPHDFRELIIHSSHAVNALQSNLRIATALSVIVTFSAVIIVYFYTRKRQEEANALSNKEVGVIAYVTEKSQI